MNILEHQAKKILKNYSATFPKGNIAIKDKYIENKPDAKLEGRSRLESLNGETKIIQGYCLPTKLIFYNINNGRFKQEYISLSRKYGGDLDTRKPEEAKIIQNLLLT